MNAERFTGRALLLILLSLGYYVIALGIVGVIGSVVWIQLAVLHTANFFTVFASMAAFAVLWSILPRFSRFVPPGPRLEAAEHPDLFGFLAALSAETQVAMPEQVFLTWEVNAGVAERGFPGLRTRYMYVGLPLLEGLSVAELRAVLAHELGHYRAGDALLGNIAYRTRARIERTIAHLAADGSRLANVFLVYGRFYLRATGALARAQETAADLFSARVAGSAHAVKALQTASMLGGVVSAFWAEEVGPVLRAGFRPALRELFVRYLRAEAVRARMVQHLESDMSMILANRFDSHPVLRDRIAAIEAVDRPGRTAEGDRPASSLLGRRAEETMLSFLLGAERLARLAPAPWADLEAAYVAIWREDVRRVEHGLRGVAFDTPPLRSSALLTFMGRLANALGVEVDERAGKALAVSFFGEALAIALHARGWRIQKEPGDEVKASSGALELEPFQVLRRLWSMELDRGEWARQCEQMGIAGVELAGALDPVVRPEPVSA